MATQLPSRRLAKARREADELEAIVQSCVKQEQELDRQEEELRLSLREMRQQVAAIREKIERSNAAAPDWN